MPEGFTPVQKKTSSNLLTRVIGNSRSQKIGTKIWQKKKTLSSLQAVTRQDKAITSLIQEPSIDPLVLQSKYNIVDRKGKAKLIEGCNEATYPKIKPKLPPIHDERFLEPLNLQEEKQLSKELPTIKSTAKREGPTILPKLQKEQEHQEPKPKKVASSSTTPTFYSVSANLSPWKTIKTWSANSQVADLITGWHKSLESGLSSQNVLGY